MDSVEFIEGGVVLENRNSARIGANNYVVYRRNPIFSASCHLSHLDPSQSVVHNPPFEEFPSVFLNDKRQSLQ